jgi:AcrR family transcriptional regulator
MFVYAGAMAAPSTPVSRRQRPAKPPLSKDAVVDVAVDLMRSEGLDRVTMRRVASALDTGPASLYVYVASTVALHAEVLDRVVADLAVPERGSWQERAEELLLAYGALLHSQRGLARSALVMRPTGPAMLGLFDTLLGLLLEGGIEAGRATWAVDLLLLVVTADAAEHAEPGRDDVDAPGDPGAGPDELRAALAAVDPDRLPNLATHADVALSGTPLQRARWQLQAILAGAAATPLPVTEVRS